MYRLHRDLPLRASQRVLEVGCGAGSRLLLLDNNVRFDHALNAGVEPLIETVARAGRAYVSNARPATAIAADPVALPFADASYDVVLCTDVLRFLDVRSAQAALREMSRVLRPAGVLVAWDLAPPSGRFGWWQRFWLRRYAGRHATANSLMSLAERSGFEQARDAELRPWLWPPIPRASFVAFAAAAVTTE